MHNISSKMMKTCASTVLSLALMILSFNSNAEQMKKLGDWDVHYIALGSTFITPEIAKIYGIERSKYKGLINISVLDGRQKSKPAVQVTMSGSAKNLIGQKQTLEFKEIIEGDAIYYIAQLDYINEEIYNIEIKLNADRKSQKLRFTQKFFVE